MANPHRGEVALVVEGTTYTLVLNTYALTLLEKRFSTPGRWVSFLDVLQHCRESSMTHIIGLLTAALHRYHPAITEEQVCGLIDTIGLETLRETLEQATAATAADPRDLPPEVARPLVATQVN